MITPVAAQSEEYATVAGIRVSVDHWIDGKRCSSRDRFDDVSPIDGSVIASVARGGAAEAAAAASAARSMFPVWAHTPKEDRAAVLYRMSAGIEARIEDFAVVETADNGGLLRAHRTDVMPRAAATFRAFADQLLQLSYPEFGDEEFSNSVAWDPAGPTLLINPWNGPLLLEAWKVAPALAAGNTVVLKPSEWSPLTASLLADVASEAGLPPGVLNVVQGLGDEVGAELTRNTAFRRISFTGSVETAKQIAKEAATTMTPVSFELGGKSPLIVTADADLDLAVQTALTQYSNSGQICLAGTRLLVESPVAEEFTERFVKAAKRLRQGDPRQDGVDIGPLIHQRHFDRVNGFVQRAVSDGARAILGGGPNEDLGGLYYLPTLLVEAPVGSEILTEEVFGPVLTLQTWEDEGQVIRMANYGRYGLAATIISGDEDRAERIAEVLIAGTVWINCFWIRDPRAPFGGARDSGIGREGGPWSFDFYCEVKNTVIRRKS